MRAQVTSVGVYKGRIVATVAFIEDTADDEIVVANQGYSYSAKEGLASIKPRVARDLKKMEKLRKVSLKDEEMVGEDLDLKGVKPAKK